MLAATVSPAGVTQQLVNLHGDIMATEPTDTEPTATFTYSEFGGVESGTPNSYGWLGGYQRSSIALAGQLLMGVRGCKPTTGRFDESDPVPGGSTNAYDYARENPLTQNDTSGSWTVKSHWWGSYYTLQLTHRENHLIADQGWWAAGSLLYKHKCSYGRLCWILSAILFSNSWAAYVAQELGKCLGAWFEPPFWEWTGFGSCAKH